METFLVSTLVVTIGEIGDKTQLLALMLAARFRRPWPICAGILVATLFNHGLAGLLGGWVRSVVNPDVLRWALGISFLAIAAWAIKPDTLEENDASPLGGYGVFAVTFAAFFLAEIGDKTQAATIALAARYDSLVAVIGGTTLGMLIADVPAVLLGGHASLKLPFKAIRYMAATLFALIGVAILGGFSF